MTLGACLASCMKRLPALDSRLLISEACGVSEKDFLIRPDMELTEAQLAKVEDFVQKRLSGQSVAYITGKKGFRYNEFFTPVGVLVPRPDTEILVESALECSFSTSPVRILDLCAGTGCVGISTALELADKHPELEIELHLSDIDDTAYDCFTKNAETLIHNSRIRVFRYKGNLFEPLDGLKFDLILSNPPYIASSVIPTLQAEVLAEPVLALDGGEDGLDVIRKIVSLAPEFLNRDGQLMMEIGYDQGSALKQLLAARGYRNIRIIRDYGNNDRVAAADAPVAN